MVQRRALPAGAARLQRRPAGGERRLENVRRAGSRIEGGAVVSALPRELQAGSAWRAQLRDHRTIEQIVAWNGARNRQAEHAPAARMTAGPLKLSCVTCIGPLERNMVTFHGRRKHLTLKRRTPPMAASLTERFWTLHDLAALPDLMHGGLAA